MKKIGIYILIIFVIISLVLLGVFIFNSNLSKNNNNPNTSVQKLSTTQIKEQPKKEVELSSFSTEILDDSEGRLTNIGITCSLINNTIVHPGEIFSFNEVVGQPSASRGYQEASIIINGEHERGIGGGNCQVSSTLYNAILAVPALEIVERNEDFGKNSKLNKEIRKLKRNKFIDELSTNKLMKKVSKL